MRQDLLVSTHQVAMVKSATNILRTLGKTQSPPAITWNLNGLNTIIMNQMSMMTILFKNEIFIYIFFES